MRSAAWPGLRRFKLTAGVIAALAGSAALLVPSHDAAGAMQPKVPAGGGGGGSVLQTEKDLNATLAQSKQEKRVLIVELTPTAERARAASERWSQPVLAAWVRRHGLAIGVSDRTTLRTLADAGIQQGSGNDPLVFRDGVFLRLMGVSASTTKSVDEKGVETWRFSTRQESRIARPKNLWPAGVDLVFKLDWTLRGLERTDNAWLAGHSTAIGAAPAWPSKVLSADWGASQATSPAGRVRETLATARTLAASDTPADLARAGELYLQLWERGVTLCPEFNIGRLTIVSAEMHALAQRHAPSKELFRKALGARWEGVDTQDIASLWDVLTLARVVDEHTPVLEFIDQSLNDADASKVMMLDERLMWELALPRMHFNGATDTAKTMSARVQSDQRRLTKKRPDIATEGEWARLMRARRFMALLEGARLTASAAQRGERAAADELRALLLTTARQTTAAPGEPDWAATIDLTVAIGAATGEAKGGGQAPAGAAPAGPAPAGATPGQK